jgi:hemolysin activation/secretion protein
MLPRYCRILAAVAALFASLPAAAQIIPSSELPGRERERFQELPTPRAVPRGPAISLPSTVAPAGADKVKLIVRGVRVTGSTVYTTEQLEPLYQDLIGNVTLAAVYDIAQRITAKYGKDGYVLSRAIVPPQELSPQGAVIHIQVVEGYIDRVEWPKSLSQYRDFFSEYTAKIIADRPTNIRTLERYLLLASDLPGLKFKNSLKPSADKQGAATLVIEVTEKPVDAMARVDNRGTRARGPWEYYTSATINNLWKMHEALTINYAGAFQTRELQYASLNWKQVLTSEGLTAFVNVIGSRGHPGTFELELLEYATRSFWVEAGMSYPFIRQREKNLTFSVLTFATYDRSNILSDLNTIDRLRGFRAKVDGDMADQWGGINALNFVLSQGIEGLGSTDNGNPFASRANGRVDYTKVELTLTRLQPLFERFSLLMAAYGQWTPDPLLSPELCGYGGRAIGRAYDPSELVGDQCIQLLGELRYDLPGAPKEITQAQLYGYADRGWLHNIAPVPGTRENENGASVGAGVRLGWQGFSNTTFNADLSAAKAVAGPRDDWRFFLIVSGRY